MEKKSAPVSHAHEDAVPGTVYLCAEDGDTTAYGQALYPVHTLDPNDPLMWPNGVNTSTCFASSCSL